MAIWPAGSNWLPEQTQEGFKMALVKHSVLYDRVSGRVGQANVVNTWNRGQSVVRAFTQPLNPDSDDQQTIRSYFSAITKEWQQVSESDRDAWAAWAATHAVINRLGTEVSRSALSAYAQLGINVMIRTGSGPAGPAPTLAQPGAPTNITTTTGQVAGDLTFVLDHAEASIVNKFLYVSITPALTSDAINPKLSAYRMIEGVATTSVQALQTTGSDYTFTSPRYTYTDTQRLGIMAWIVTSEGYAGRTFRKVVEWLV